MELAGIPVCRQAGNLRAQFSERSFVESTELQSNLLYQDFKTLHQVFLELETEREMNRIRALEK